MKDELKEKFCSARPCSKCKKIVNPIEKICAEAWVCDGQHTQKFVWKTCCPACGTIWKPNICGSCGADNYRPNDNICDSCNNETIIWEYDNLN